MYFWTIPCGAVLLAFNTQFFHCIFGVGNFAKNLPNIGKGWEIVCYLIQIYIKKKKKQKIRYDMCKTPTWDQPVYHDNSVLTSLLVDACFVIRRI